VKYDRSSSARRERLVTAHFLARAGKRVLSWSSIRRRIRRRFGWIPTLVIRDLRLADSGLRIEQPDPWITAPLPAGGRSSCRATSAIDGSNPPHQPRGCANGGVCVGCARSPRARALYLVPPPDIESNDVRELTRIPGLACTSVGRQADVIDLARRSADVDRRLLDDWFERRVKELWARSGSGT